MRTVFISYRRDDSRYPARQIYHALRRVLPSEQVFMDVDSIPLGHDFRGILRDWVEGCDIMLALIGPGWLDMTDPRTGKRRLDSTNDFVRIEIAAALTRGIPVVPVLLDGAHMPLKKQLPRDLRRLPDRQAEEVSFRTFDADVGRMIRRLGLVDPAIDSDGQANTDWKARTTPTDLPTADPTVSTTPSVSAASDNPPKGHVALGAATEPTASDPPTRSGTLLEVEITANEPLDELEDARAHPPDDARAKVNEEMPASSRSPALESAEGPS